MKSFTFGRRNFIKWWVVRAGSRMEMLSGGGSGEISFLLPAWTLLWTVLSTSIFLEKSRRNVYLRLLNTSLWLLITITIKSNVWLFMPFIIWPLLTPPFIWCIPWSPHSPESSMHTDSFCKHTRYLVISGPLHMPFHLFGPIFSTLNWISPHFFPTSDRLLLPLGIILRTSNIIPVPLLHNLIAFCDHPVIVLITLYYS